MASAAAQVPIFKELRCFSNEKPMLLGHVARSRNNLVLPRQSIKDLSVLTFARRRGTASKSSPVSSKKLTKKQNLHSKSTPDDEDEDAFEALFQQLEEDLKNDNVSIDESDDDINEDDIAQLEAELEEALKDDELLGALGSTGDTKEEYESESGVDEEGSDDYQNSFNDQEPDDEGDDEESFENLRTWQVKRLAYALKNGRRKSSIKNLAAELCLDRAIVLRLLRDPPPDLLMLSAALPDNPVSRILEPKNESIEIASLETATSNSRAEAKSKLPVHVMQRNWSAQKRLKRAQRETLEKVYGRTKRPTNAMISSIVQVTHLPRKRVVKWFEDKRTEDGVPDHRVPYQRSADAQLQ